MKKIMTLLVGFTFIVGCAGADFKREVSDDNIFYSTHKPSIKIKINPEFKLIKDQHRVKIVPETHIKKETFVFQHTKNKSRKTIAIQFSRITKSGVAYNPNFFSNATNLYDRGSIYYLGKFYDFCINAEKIKSGYRLNKLIGCRTGLYNEGLFLIVYSEIVSDGDWSNIKNISHDQQEHLLRFIEQSEKDIKIIE